MEQKSIDLKTFIEESINQIFDAVKSIQEKRQDGESGYINPEGALESQMGMISPDVEKIKFDVAVLANEKDGSSAGISVFTGVFGTGVKGNHEIFDAITSKIQFEIPVIYPIQKMKEKQKKIKPTQDNPWVT